MWRKVFATPGKTVIFLKITTESLSFTTGGE